MPKMIGVNIGFVTNSSSVVYHFPAEVLSHPDVKAFIEALEIRDGFVGEDLWNRGLCETFAVTKEQKAKVARELQDSEYCRGPAINVDSNEVVVIYGDEYPGLAMTLASLLQEAVKAAGLGERVFGDDYN